MKKYFLFILCTCLLVISLVLSSTATEIQTEEIPMQTVIQTENGPEFTKYYSLEDFRNLSMDSITHTVTSGDVTAVFNLSGTYTEDGVLLYAKVKDKEIIGGNETNSANDYYELIFQVPATSYLQKNWMFYHPVLYITVQLSHNPYNFLIQNYSSHLTNKISSLLHAGMTILLILF